MSDKRSRLEADERASAAKALAARLDNLPELRAAMDSGGCVAGFAATRGEVDPAPALAAVRAQGAVVAWPRVADGVAGARLRFHLAEGGELNPGRFGIAEPPPGALEVAPRDVAVMLVPGLAFDAQGNRLGFGGGYYDEVLGRGASVAGSAGWAGPDRPALVVGVGYDFQLVDRCPADERDARVDCVVTDARVIRCRDDRKVAP